MKRLILVFILFSLCGCGVFDRTMATFTRYTKICVDGVSYLQFTSGAALQVEESGRPVICK